MQVTKRQRRVFFSRAGLALTAPQPNCVASSYYGLQDQESVAARAIDVRIAKHLTTQFHSTLLIGVSATGVVHSPLMILVAHPAQRFARQMQN
jgi:hypothetical protein